MCAKFTLTAFATLALGLGYCTVAPAQLYTAPTIGSVRNLTQIPSINTQVNRVAFAQRSAGYGGVRSPANSALPTMQSNARVSSGVYSSQRTSKPFSSYNSSSSPAVSPYLNLFRTDLNGGGNFNYSTLVQPQLQQQQLNQQLERQAAQNNRRLQAIAAQADFNEAGSKNYYPTGHQTVTGYFGHYYQQQRPVQKRR
jgi:hypothetical protein